MFAVESRGDADPRLVVQLAVPSWPRSCRSGPARQSCSCTRLRLMMSATGSTHMGQSSGPHRPVYGGNQRQRVWSVIRVTDPNQKMLRKSTGTIPGSTPSRWMGGCANIIQELMVESMEQVVDRGSCAGQWGEPGQHPCTVAGFSWTRVQGHTAGIDCSTFPPGTR
jgi:hypothetical protein